MNKVDLFAKNFHVGGTSLMQFSLGRQLGDTRFCVLGDDGSKIGLKHVVYVSTRTVKYNAELLNF